MEFGKIDRSTLDQVNFYLPDDREETSRLLSQVDRREPKQLAAYVGCAKWGRKDWIGRIYPEGTRESDFLAHYGRFFNSIELNATFYRLPSITQTSAWSKQVGSEFRFSPKVSQIISHIKRLKDVKELSDRFFRGITGFGEKLGPVFLMPHPAIGPKGFDTLRAFVDAMPSDVKVFVEMRHKEWFGDQESFKKLFDFFESAGVGSVITDAAGRRDCVHVRLTVPEAFIRFVGNGLHPSDYARVDEWVQRIRKWKEQGLKAVYFFMHQEDEVHSPELAQYVISKLNEHCGTQLQVPRFLSA